jgi:hypothetical protein
MGSGAVGPDEVGDGIVGDGAGIVGALGVEVGNPGRLDPPDVMGGVNDAADILEFGAV